MLETQFGFAALLCSLIALNLLYCKVGDCFEVIVRKINILFFLAGGNIGEKVLLKKTISKSCFRSAILEDSQQFLKM